MPPNALDYITIRGFKSIASIEKLPLTGCNVLIGANGSGKSNFIGVFEFLHAIREGRLRNYVIEAGGAEKVLHFGSKTTKAIYIRLSSLVTFARPENYWELHLAPTKDDSLYSSFEFISQRDKNGTDRTVKAYTPRFGQEGEGGSATDESALGGETEWLRPLVGGWRVYHVHDTSSTSPMRKTAKVDDNRFLRPDGSNLAAFLYFLHEREEASYSLIRRTVQRVAPFFDDFRLEPLRLKPDDIKLEWRHKNSDQYFDASSLSDGTLRFIALATLFLQPKQYLPSVILVDEPELGLHPYAIEMLTSLIRAASTNTQVIVSTQSSLLLDHLEPDDVLVANRVGGATEITRLESARLAEWLKDYSLGQLWEKNEFAGRPNPE
ncbi:MAG: AAA family ATPase [Terriglobia bacterium]|jgi:predicted ATPase